MDDRDKFCDACGGWSLGFDGEYSPAYSLYALAAFIPGIAVGPQDARRGAKWVVVPHLFHRHWRLCFDLLDVQRLRTRTQQMGSQPQGCRTQFRLGMRKSQC